MTSRYLVNLNDFKIIRKLNSGGFGTVYLIKYKFSDKYFAAKVNHFQGNDKYSLCNRREINILIQIQHPTIVEFVGYSNKDFSGLDQTTIIMKYMSKGSLSDLIEKEIKRSYLDDYDNTKRQIILIGIARGMMIFHNQNAIHRDLKSANVLLDDNYNPCITDFGLSKFYDPKHSMEQSAFQVGTLTYMAPEVLEGSDYNKSADVYSFGILMYEVLNSTRAYKKDIDNKITAFNLANKIKSGYRPIFMVNVKEGLKNLVERCWSRNLNERPTFSEIFQKLSMLQEGNFVPLNSKKIGYYERRRAMQYCLDDVNFDEIYEYIQKVSDDKLLKKKPYIFKPQPANLATEKIEGVSLVMPPSSPRPENVSPRLIFLQENSRNKKIYDTLYSRITEPISSQKSFLSNLIRGKTNVNPFVIKLKKFVEFLSDGDSYNFFNYNADCNENEIIDEPQIYIHYSLTQKWISDFSFNNEELIDALREFKKVYIEIDFKSDYFDSIIGTIVNIKKVHKCKIAASVIFDNPRHIKPILQQYCIIEIVKLRQFSRKNFLENFSECSSLKYFVLDELFSNYINHIKDNAFKNCSSLQEFSFNYSLTYIGKNAFQGCFSCRKIYCPNGIDKINDNAFQGCFMLKTIVCNYIKKIGLNAFEGCTSLKLLQINKIDKLCSNSFKGCYALERLTINDIDTIESNAFDGCNSLEEIKTYVINKIESNAFIGCTSLKKITAHSIHRINSNAFDGCHSLEEITINIISTIESNAFKGCISLQKINALTIDRINSNAFDGCNSLEEITTYIINTIESNAFKGCTSLKKITAYNIGQINSNAFDGCSSLKEINAKIHKIGSNSFKNCSSLEKITYVIQPNTPFFEEGAFEGCTSLKIVVIYSSNGGKIKQIKKKAFERCSSLSNLQDNIEAEIIEESAFENCSKLEYFNLSFTKEIKSRCFAYCSSLKQIKINNNICHIPTFAFYGCSSLTSLTIPSSVKIIDDYAFGLCKSLTHVLLPSSLQKIGLKAFSFCTSLMFISIPISVKSIGSNAFCGCLNLREISLPSTFDIKSIGLDHSVSINKL